MTNPQPDSGAPDSAEDSPLGDGDLAALLERLLAEADRTQKELAEASGIKYPTLNAWMNRTRGTSRINPDHLRKMAQVLRRWGAQVTPREVFEAAGRVVPGPTDEEREARLLRIYRALPARQQRSLIGIAEDMAAAIRIS
ncbi:helix-turn-helix transcriptional regulator [Streptomyces sp. NPDC005918]|uniref:helix-turn-helix domain-containing protein n=1 Tax=Streptomyces sp. NPDC005918 TaxID=3155454 RepID=UPI0033E59C4F